MTWHRDQRATTASAVVPQELGSRKTVKIRIEEKRISYQEATTLGLLSDSFSLVLQYSLMDSEAHSLQILFFPLMAAGHMIPMVDMAKLFAARGACSTILTTPSNGPLIQQSLDRAKTKFRSHLSIQLSLLPAPGLALSYENAAATETQDMRTDFFLSLSVLRQPFEQILKALRPDCVVVDMFFPWAFSIAREHDIPFIVFHGTSFFSLCIEDCLSRHRPHEGLASASESFVLPGLPHRIEMQKSQFVDFNKLKPQFVDLVIQSLEVASKSDGVLVNSFYELEPDYAEHYRKVIGVRAWHIGPVSLCNRDPVEQLVRGDKSSIDCTYCLSWLDSKKPSSVVYVCFGSMFQFPTEQLRELALGLEASNHHFIWVVKSNTTDWLPQGYEERIVGGGKGLIIRGWAPQMLILGHQAVGGFVTHCGWNSSLEAITAGKPMLTWPLFADQFNNERLIVDVLRIGIGVGVKDYVVCEDEMVAVKGEEIRRAVDRLMSEGEEAEGMRRRVEDLAEMAQRAVEEGGSSYVDIGNLIQELMERRATARRR